jgi:trans-AT polyketide synthase/acyltransferase/oxidoreductase domain-containing protein
MLAYLFPGQGAQTKGMGGELFDTGVYPPALEREIDALLGYSLRETCLEGSPERLRQTEVTQPCLYVVNALYHLRQVATGATPAFFAGHSLGEFNALLAADAFDLLTGLELVKHRGRLMARAPAGGMAAVLGLSLDQLERTLAENSLLTLDVANLNTPTQLVISGPVADIQRVEPLLKTAGAAAFIPLQVSAPFHSRYMAGAAEEFASIVERTTFRPLSGTVIANATAAPYPSNDAATLKSLLVRQMTSQVRWAPTIALLKAQGVQDFVEVGPGVTLTRMIPQIPVAARTGASLRGQPVEFGEAPQVDGAASLRPAGAGNLRSANAEPSGPAKQLLAEHLGSSGFRRAFGIRYAYAAGAMYKGIASVDLVLALSRRGLLGFFGAGGLELAEVEAAIRRLRLEAPAGAAWGVNLLAQEPAIEEKMVDLLLRHNVRNIEAAAFISMTPALVRYRLKGLSPGEPPLHRVLAKCSRPEVAAAFMRPAPAELVRKLREQGSITPEQAGLAQTVPMADDICVEADSGGHTDGGVALALLPAILLLRDQIRKEYLGPVDLRVGAAGGIGTPHAAAAAFIMGAEFIVTGSINQCTVEAGTSDAAKDLLQSVEAQDTAYAPAGDMFEYGARVQVARKGLFFHTRANKLFDLYQRHNSLEEIDTKTIQQIEEKYFHRSIDSVWQETASYLRRSGRGDPTEIEKRPKQKMAMVFKWYFVHATELALSGSATQRVDYQIQCGPAMGAFNSWVKGTNLENWRNRRVADIAERLMAGTADLLAQRIAALTGASIDEDPPLPDLERRGHSVEAL